MVIQVRQFHPDNVCKLLMRSLEDAVSASSKATICVNGTENALTIISVLAKNIQHEILNHVHLFFLDEKAYPADDEERTDHKVIAEWGKHGPTPNFIHPLIIDHTQLEKSLEIAKKDFLEFVPENRFDLLITDIDDNGAFGSLLPESEGITADQDIILIDNPEYPPKRITYTMKVVSATKKRIMIALGKRRGTILGRAASSKHLRKKIPITYLPKDNATWFVDEDGLYGFLG